MSHQARAAAAVDDALERLRETHGDVPVVESEWTVDRVVYDRTVERFEAGTVGGAGAWVTRERDGATEALVVRHEGEQGWSEPAGKQEPGESLAETAVRETSEETGVDCRLTGLLRVERARHVVRDHDGDRPPIPRLIVVFSADRVGGTLSPQTGEIAETKWAGHHPEPLKYPGVGDLPIE